MSNQKKNSQEDGQNVDFPFFYTQDEHVPFWDDPTVTGYRHIPDKFKPILSLEGALELERRGHIDEMDITLLKIIGDSICANEAQLRRYFQGILSPSKVSAKIKRFQRLSLVERWQLKSDLYEEKYPAPVTLGFAAVRYLKYFYSHQFFMNPDRWDRLGIGSIQRYVALNELRCQLVEKRKLKNWVWQPVINRNPHLPRPHAVAEVDTHKGPVNFVVTRPQMGLDYLSFLKNQLEAWNLVFSKYKKLSLHNVSPLPNVIVIYGATRTFIDSIQQQIEIGKYHFPIWFCSEEDLLTIGAKTAFYVSNEHKLTRISLDFLK